MFGGITADKERAITTNDVFTLRIHGGEWVWNREKPRGDIPLPRAHHAACEIAGDRLLVFGGIYTSNQKFRDIYLLHVPSMTWSQPPNQHSGAEPDNSPNPLPGGPEPRAYCTVNRIGDKAYVFGGHGGVYYQRRSYNTLHVLDLNTWEWEKLEPEGQIPEARGGHSACVIKKKLFIYGGWSASTQFNNCFLFDSETLEWQDLEILYGIPRWNMGAIFVEAIPSDKFFVFGGSQGDFDEGAQRNKGVLSQQMAVLDINSMKFSNVDLEDELADPNDKPIIPKSREFSQIIYEKNESRLIMFGGWDGNWIGDLHSLSVSKIVGPPYAVEKCVPERGPVTGRTKVTIYGVGFQDTSQITVKFICQKQTFTANATFVSETEITCETPNIEQIGPKEAEIRVSFRGGAFTITSTNFQYFLNTRAHKSLAYGPGLLAGGAAGKPTVFFIQARNDLGENRKSGADNFKVKIVENVEEGQEIPFELIDRNDGSYLVQYTPGPGEVKIDVQFEDEKEDVYHIRGSPFIASFVEGVAAKNNDPYGPLMQQYITSSLNNLEHFMQETNEGIAVKSRNFAEDVKGLLRIKTHIENAETEADNIVLTMDVLNETLKMFEAKDLPRDSDIRKLSKLGTNWNQLQKNAKEVKKDIAPSVATESDKCKQQIKNFDEELKTYFSNIKKQNFQRYDYGVFNALRDLNIEEEKLTQHKEYLEELDHLSKNFGFPEAILSCQRQLESNVYELKVMRQLWDHIELCLKTYEDYLKTPWSQVESLDWEEDNKKLGKDLRDIKVDRKCNAFLGINGAIKTWTQFLPLVSQLKDKAMCDRHWAMLKKEVKQDFILDERLTLQRIYDLDLPKYSEQVEEIAEQARSEAKMETTLKKIKEYWDEVVFLEEPHKNSDLFLLKMDEENFENLEDHQVQVQNMYASRFLAYFEETVNFWQRALSAIFDITQALGDVQRLWSFLETLFIHSDEVKRELPEVANRFVDIDREVKDILRSGKQVKNIKDFSLQDDISDRLENVQKELAICERALHEFLDGKRMAFPRFYFVATADLLDILSNGNNPPRIMMHMSKVFQAIKELTLDTSGGDRPFATEIISAVGIEKVTFKSNVKLMGKVENYLQLVIDNMRETLRLILDDSQKRFAQQNREEWIPVDPSQITLLVNLFDWVNKTEAAFRGITQGNANALQQYYREEVEQLTSLIRMVRGDLTAPVRTKLMCLITMDTHSRDILEQLIEDKVKDSEDFQWQRQLRAYWTNETCQIRVCDAILAYGYEYLGNGPRLVVTPLTDRIYVTATQALHLKMGCAPAGPAGTGKTETTKDLASAAGKACYVFNCSDQMDYLSMGNIFKGLASSGSWGCFDEFNRLIPEVLSVCSVQFKAVTDAIRRNDEKFTIQGDTISLDPSCGVFITMNPGYLGRSELPEGLKTLFRPITVVVPDLGLICENMLMAEGFESAKILATKFTVLYALCKDLLSKQLHYDWGLRAIKSVLVVAGGFKRGEPDLPEDMLLMRALRDFNLPKIVEEDLPVFHGLLNDLFPGLNPERKRDYDFEDVIKQSCVEFKLYPEPECISKVVQLSELLVIRHCVFIMGNPGAGKSMTWKLLAKSNEKVGKKTTAVDINPKAISTNELYGYNAMPSREWKDGLLSKTMRELGKIPDTLPKWLVLDGDLDANWIESMNSVMDDNKILTLASNERIPLYPHMRMIFEIRDLKFASPATVSRAGILFISDNSGYQWRSYYKAWIENSQFDETTRDGLDKLFQRYLPKTLSYLRKSCKFVVPVVGINLVTSLCYMLQSLLVGEIKALEYWFVFCTIWAIGGSLSEKDGVDYKRNFSNWWKGKWKTIKFPGKGTIFDYYVNYETSRLEEWDKLVETIEFDSSSHNMANITVPTPETVSNSYFVEAFIKIHKAVLLIGNAGCGKTQLAKGIINRLSIDEFCNMAINFNYYTDSGLLQNIMEQPPIEKKTGKQFGPPGKLRLIYFIDDLNMPQLDDYLTQTAIALLRQHADYGHWYDRGKMTLKEIINSQYLAAMNPTAGSFFVNPRLQRHFWHLTISFPEANSLFTIYNTFATGHFSKGFKASVQENISFIIKAAIMLHPLMVTNFRKTAINFHYEFSVRHLANIFQGLLVAQPAQFSDPEKLIRLWIHESERIYGDRLVSADHISNYKAIMADLVKKTFGRFSGLQRYFQSNSEPLIFCHFAGGLVESIYDQVSSLDSLFEILTEALKEYNDLNAEMALVLFEDAMKHVCRISRIIKNSSGHALLVGVGGSGKQSLSRLASFICGYTTTQITISQTYSMNDLKTDLIDMYAKAGLKDEGIMFLFTEGQITNERFLVYINDLLSSGEIADLYAIEDKDTIVNQIRPAVKGAGIQDTRDNCWNFFIQRVKNNLHMALCFSPVGGNFRQRARKFPALVNCTVIDWFHDWPVEALTSVAARFLHDVELGDEAVRDAVVEYMPFSFYTVNVASERYKLVEKRYCYTTPKSFLELLKLFQNMLQSKKNEIDNNKSRLEDGLVKLIETGENVAQLEEDLKVMQVEVKEKSDAAAVFAEEVGIEKAKVSVENDAANVEAEKCAVIQRDVEAQKASCEEDLEKALPLVEKAQEALDKLDKKDFQTMKSFTNPVPAVQDVGEAVLYILASVDPAVVVDKNGNVQDKSWKGFLKLLSNPEAFKKNLLNFKSHIDNISVPAKNFKNVRQYLAKDDFTGEAIFSKSNAAAGLCEWVRNIVAYFDVISEVEPKRIALKKAEQDLQDANDKLEIVNARVAELQAQLAGLIAKYDAAMAEKEAAENEAARCERKLDLAQRLVSALGSEKDRWGEGIEEYGKKLEVIVGDVLLAASFVSYVGPFTKRFRDELINSKFIPFMKQKAIPFSPNPDPLAMLTNPATVAKWNNQKLPSDPVSIENGAILTNTERWPLIIDPQLQGITWIKEKEALNNLQVVRLTYKNMLNTIGQSIELGYSVIIENLEESIDAVLNPVIARNTIRKGRLRFLKIGDKEHAVDDKFKLFLHTKLSNPHYPPEIQAETALINFTVTQVGLEDQLLALVVKKERPDLASQKEALIQQENEFKIKLKELEDDVLFRLTNAEGDILENIELIENLEKSKQISADVKEKMEIAKDTAAKIFRTSEFYRPAAARGALTFFLMNDLYKIHSFYMFSLESYIIVVNRAIDIVAEKYRAQSASQKKRGEEDDEEKNPEEEEEKGEDDAEKEEEEEKIQELSPRSLSKRVGDIIDSITFQSYDYIRRGLFERHKLLVVTMLCLRILIKDGTIDEAETGHLIQGKVSTEPGHQHDNLQFIQQQSFAMVRALEQIPTFTGLVSSMEGDFLQWKKWYMEEKGETADLPRNYKEISSFHKLLLIRAMRGDRITSALTLFIREHLGDQFIEQMPFNMNQVYAETSRQTPVFFVLFPGEDPTIAVEHVGEQYGITAQNGMFINISMGQGQEENAEKALDKLGEQGGWIMLQNVHLMQSWLKRLESKLEVLAFNGHENFRCFISSEPPGLPHMKIIPESILQNSIKVANEAPQDLKANLRRAYNHFDQPRLESCSKTNEFKSLLFGLCMFHALVLGRRKFGSQGWSKSYSFNDGDLTICADVLNNYLERYEQVPYSDLRYIFGDIMYGGHITDHWDRITCRTYLEVLIRPEILSNMPLAPGFRSPDPSRFDYDAYYRYIEEKLPIESPQMFGLHPNAEINYLTATGDTIFNTIQDVQGGTSSGGVGKKDEDVAMEVINNLLDKLPDSFNMIELQGKMKEITPDSIVCLQECERMNTLLNEIRKSLVDLQMGLTGALNITEQMESVQAALIMNRVPKNWEDVAYWSKKTLQLWYLDLLDRVTQLEKWSADFTLPKSLWISGLFNPMSFLTAVMQITARAKGLPLDNMTLQTYVTNVLEVEEITQYPENGTYIHGYFLEGAAWEQGRNPSEEGYLTDSQLKDLHPRLPVVNVIATPLQEKRTVGIYNCPVYVTTMRGPTFVFTAGLRMESDDSDANKWILAGVALLQADD